MLNRKLLLAILPLALPIAGLFSSAAQAVVPAEEAAQLGQSLTPIGAEQTANADGSIPAWTGGLTTAPKGFADGGKLIDPFAEDEPLFTITRKNLDKYREQLSQGQIKLFEQYPDSYEMQVYPTRRSALFPQWLYDETKLNATRVNLTKNGSGFTGAVRGFPFPIPKNGREAMWNHMARYFTTGIRGYVNSAATTKGGDYVVERSKFEIAFHYNHPDTTLENFDNKNLYVLTKVTSPASKAGDAHLLHVPLDRSVEDTLVYIYNPGQRKVHRIGEIGYDNPASDGLMTHDQIDMFNGPMDRYQFQLLGKKEIYVPYNNYQLSSDEVEYDELIDQGHIDQEFVRYEKHRMWMVEATRLPDVKHIYSKRVFYIDEDSWLILLQDIYDDRGEFWRTAITHALTYYNIPLVANPVQVHYDLQSRRYVVLNLTNEEKEPIQYNWYEPPGYFSTSQLKRFATRP